MLRRATIAMMFCCVAGSLAAQTLQVQTVAGSGAVVGENFLLPLHVTGGTQPYTWQLTGGELPPGCKLHPHAGNISGVPNVPGEYHFTLTVGDSGIPQAQTKHEFTVHVIAGLTVEWKQGPAVQGTTISGSALISNQTPDNFDLTVVVVAVNQIGRATTLGYQHFQLPAQGTQVIPFSANPGPETYYVRADAVAHHTGRRRIYRASKQTSASLTVTQF